MGMTIEENIATLKKHLNTLNVDKGLEFYQEIESIQSAIETMRKYEKIVQIMERTVDDGTSMYDTLQEIEEVVEDGNDD